MQIQLLANLYDKQTKYSYEVENNAFAKTIYHYEMIELLKKSYISLNDDLFKDYISNNINLNEQLTLSQREVFEQSFYLQGVAIFAIYILSEMPKSLSKWEESPFENDNLGQSWKDNVNAGPIWDQDETWINWIGHPVSGAWYYTLARNKNFDPFESFVYSTLLSSFLWEYGYESFAEIPSLQDLVLTPVMGSVLGEYMYMLEREIDMDEGEVLGSKTLGSICYFFINPLGNMSSGLGNLLGISTTIRFQTYQLNNNNSQNMHNKIINKPKQFSQNAYGLYINLEY